MDVSEVLGFEPESLWMPTTVVHRTDVEPLAKAVSDMAAGANVAFYTEGGQSFAKYNPNQPRDAQGQWVSTGDVSGAIGNLTKMKELFGRLKPEDTDAAEQLVAFLQENGASEEDAKQAMKEATGKESTGANKPDPAKVAAAGGSTKPAVEPKKEASPATPSNSSVEYLASPPSFRGPAAAEAREKVIASLGPLGEGVDTYTVSTIAGASESAGLKPGMSASDPKAIEVAGMLDMKPEALVAVVNAVHDPQFAPVKITPLEFRGREHSLAVAQKLEVPPNTVGQAVSFSEQAQVTADIAPEDPRLFKYANSVNGHPAHIVKAIAHEIGPAPAAPNIAPPETVHRSYKEGETRRVIDSLTPELEEAGNAVELTPALKAYTAEANTMSLGINRAAREGKLDSLPATERQVFEQLNSQIKEKKTKFSEPINLYRGIAIPDEQAGVFMQNITAAAEAGSPIEMKGLISSSLSPGIASRFATMSDPALGKTTPMVFEMKSHSGMYVGKRSIAPQEMEMMHEHGSRYRVLGVEKQVNVGGLVTTLIKLEQL